MCFNYNHFQVPDTRIPELVHKALVMNQEAVLSYEEVNFKLSQVQEDYNSLQRQFKVHIHDIDDRTVNRKAKYAFFSCFKEVVREKSYLESNLESVSERLSRREERLQRSGEEYQEDLEAAAELAEKQNALAMTLEAKVDILEYFTSLNILHVIEG